MLCLILSHILLTLFFVLSGACPDTLLILVLLECFVDSYELGWYWLVVFVEHCSFTYLYFFDLEFCYLSIISLCWALCYILLGNKGGLWS